jgi:dTMP kinase
MAGKTVVADRYADSTIAYQSFGLGVPLDDVRSLAAIATGGLRPDVTVYVDIEPEEGLARMVSRGARDRLDAQAIDFHHRVREGYGVLMREEPKRWLAVDGSGVPEIVQAAIMEAIEPRL